MKGVVELSLLDDATAKANPAAAIPITTSAANIDLRFVTCVTLLIRTSQMILRSRRSFRCELPQGTRLSRRESHATLAGDRPQVARGLYQRPRIGPGERYVEALSPKLSKPAAADRGELQRAFRWDRVEAEGETAAETVGGKRPARLSHLHDTLAACGT